MHCSHCDEDRPLEHAFCYQCGRLLAAETRPKTCRICHESIDDRGRYYCGDCRRLAATLRMERWLQTPKGKAYYVRCVTRARAAGGVRKVDAPPEYSVSSNSIAVAAN